MANITVQNSAAANVIYVAKVPSAGDKSAAVWLQDAAHAIVGFRPKFEVLTRDNGSSNARLFSAYLLFPVVEAVNGVDTVVARVPIRCEATLPTNVSSTKVADATVQAGNLLVSTLIREVLSTGYAPT
jgi:hypothetical protein